MELLITAFFFFGTWYACHFAYKDFIKYKESIDDVVIKKYKSALTKERIL